jgi:hypothetical protein
MFSMVTETDASTLFYCLLLGAAIGIIIRIIRNLDDGYS